MDKSRKTLVLLTRSPWDETPRIRHQIAEEMSKYYNVVFVTTPGLETPSTDQTNWRTIHSHLHVLSIASKVDWDGRLQLLLYPFYFFRQRKWLQEIIQKLKEKGCREAVLINFHFYFLPIYFNRFFIRKIYLCNDDWVASYNHKIAKVLAWYLERLTIKWSDTCLAVSYPLVSKLKRVTRNSHLFFPAHNFRSLLAESGFSRRGHGLKVGFWGFINNRINIDWIVTATRLDKALEFYFCGPVELSDHKIEFLSHPNIHFQKSCQGDEAVKFLKQMDVLIMPYVLMESVLAITANNKLFFYLAAGKPIVISNMPNFMRFERGIIYVAKSSEDFVKEIRRAFNEDCEGLVGRRLQIAAQNTWKVRGEELMKHIESSPQTY